MRLTRHNTPSLNKNITEEIVRVIEKSLNDIITIDNKFIINDSLWYAKNRKSAITPCVLNSASFISKTFQSNLATNDGWQGETKIDNQNFDGYGTVTSTGVAYQLKEEKILSFLKEYLESTNTPDYLISKYFTLFYGMYIKRKLFSLENIPLSLHHYFIETQPSSHLRVGVEFETGNIGSSFRAILKLNNLFLKNHIDIGVFITSDDKENGAARIWPVSNRNGSFEELKNRNYSDNVNLPLFEIGFSPDSFSRSVSYLGEHGTLFNPRSTTKTVTSKGKYYAVYLGDNDDEILAPILE